MHKDTVDLIGGFLLLLYFTLSIVSGVGALLNVATMSWHWYDVTTVLNAVVCVLTLFWLVYSMR